MPVTGDNTEHTAEINTQAVTWLVRLTSGDITSDELAAFERWRQADSRHETALAEARGLWVSMGMSLENYYQPNALNGISPHGQGRRRFWRWQIMLLTAGLLLFSVMMTHNWLNRWQYDHYTGSGEQRMLSLDDGSRMWLDADSAADVRVNSGQRFVRLARGEAFFDVVHNPVQTFIVDAGVGEVKVLGTAFAVQHDGDGMVVTVERGRVELSRKDHPDMQLNANQQAALRNGQDSVKIATVNAGQILSWHQGQLLFEEQPLGTIIAALKRYDKRVIVFNSKRLAAIKLNAIIDINHLDDWYDGLQQSLPVNIIRAGPVVWLRERH